MRTIKSNINMGRQSKFVSNTRIYTDSRALLDEILDIMPNFPRAYRFSIGTKMQDLGVGAMQDVAAAYLDKANRLNHLVSFQSKFETLKTLIRIAGERKWINGKGRHAHIVELMEEIGKQSSAWKNSVLARASAEQMPESVS